LFNLTSVEGILKLDGVIVRGQFGVAPPPTRKAAKPKARKTQARPNPPAKVDGVTSGGPYPAVEAPRKQKLAKPPAKGHRPRGNRPKVEQG
jgi:hypothetical protein